VPDPDLAFNSRIGVASPILQRLEIWRTQQGSLSPVNVICQNVGGVLIAYGCDCCRRGYKNLVPKLLFRRGVIQNLIILKSFRFLIFFNSWLSPKVVTK
jgi:hypothetical protein